MEKVIKFEFHTNGGLFNQQNFKSETLSRNGIICDHFANDDELIIMLVRETQELTDHFSLASKTFGLTIKRNEIVHQSKSIPKQIRR